MRRLGVGCVALGLAILIAVACGSTSHIYPARRFDRARGCVDPISSLDVVDGTEPGGLCALVCLVATTGDGGDRAIFVGTECEPYPPFFDVSGSDPDCVRAMDAFTAGPSCLADGGVSEGGPADTGADVTPPPDAGPADAGVDANDDASDSAITDADTDAG